MYIFLSLKKLSIILLLVGVKGCTIIGFHSYKQPRDDTLGDTYVTCGKDVEGGVGVLNGSIAPVLV